LAVERGMGWDMWIWMGYGYGYAEEDEDEHEQAWNGWMNMTFHFTRYLSLDKYRISS
jgi:hypothetical protein